MKANLFALFCITLFVLSVPQAFAESDTNSTITEVPAVEKNTTETPVTEVVETVPAPVEEQPNVPPTKPATETKEPAAGENKAVEDTVTEEPEGTPATVTEEKEDGADKVEAAKPVEETESDPETTSVTPKATTEGEQGSTDNAEAKKSDEEVVVPPAEGNTTAIAPESEGQNKTIETPAALTETPETTGTTETPADSTETPKATNATEPSTPVSYPEESQETAPAAEESQETAPAAEESQETAPAAETEEKLEEKDGLSIFGLISKVLVGLGILSVVILVGCVYHYRYQMQKYKIAPFTPPSFLPECLFPKSTESSSRLVSGYTELQVGNYQSAPRFAQV